jgi:hypothetical protein
VPQATARRRGGAAYDARVAQDRPFLNAGLVSVSLALCAALGGCTPAHAVRPLGRGHGVLEAALGGPLVRVSGNDVPMPILSLGGGYGLRDDTELTLHGDVTAGVFGVLHLEPGAAYHPIVREAGLIPTLTVAGSVHLLTNIEDTLVAPHLTGAAAWRIRRRHLIYLGVDTALALRGRDRLIVGPLVGGEARIGRVGVSLEMKWLAPNYDVTPTAPDWLSPGGRGYFAVLLGARYYLGDVK